MDQKVHTIIAFAFVSKIVVANCWLLLSTSLCPSVQIIHRFLPVSTKEVKSKAPKKRRSIYSTTTNDTMHSLFYSCNHLFNFLANKIFKTTEYTLN